MAKAVDPLFSKFEPKRENIIPILQVVQEAYSYIPERMMGKIADFVHVPKSDIYGVATFYAQFRFEPTGDNILSVCRGTACHVRGAPGIFDEVTDLLNLEGEGTTADGKYTVETVACIGCCALAPVITINEEVHGNLTKKDVRNLLDEKEKLNEK